MEIYNMSDSEELGLYGALPMMKLEEENRFPEVWEEQLAPSDLAREYVPGLYSENCTDFANGDATIPEGEYQDDSLLSCRFKSDLSTNWFSLVYDDHILQGQRFLAAMDTDRNQNLSPETDACINPDDGTIEKSSDLSVPFFSNHTEIKRANFHQKPKSYPFEESDVIPPEDVEGAKKLSIPGDIEKSRNEKPNTWLIPDDLVIPWPSQRSNPSPERSVFNRLFLDAEKYKRNRSILAEKNQKDVKLSCPFQPKICRGTKIICDERNRKSIGVFDRLTAENGKSLTDITSKEKVAVESFRVAFENQISTETKNILRNSMNWRSIPCRQPVEQEASPTFTPELCEGTHILTRNQQPNVYKRLSRHRHHAADCGVQQYLKEVEDSVREVPEINKKITKKLLGHKNRGDVWNRLHNMHRQREQRECNQLVRSDREALSRTPRITEKANNLKRPKSFHGLQKDLKKRSILARLRTLEKYAAHDENILPFKPNVAKRRKDESSTVFMPTRRLSCGAYSYARSDEESIKECSFAPVINKNYRRAWKDPIHKRFEKVKKEKQMRIEQKSLKCVRDDLQQCTFKPYLFKSDTSRELSQKIPVRGLREFLIRNKNIHQRGSCSDDKFPLSTSENDKKNIRPSTAHCGTLGDLKSQYTVIQNKVKQCYENIK